MSVTVMGNTIGKDNDLFVDIVSENRLYADVYAAGKDGREITNIKQEYQVGTSATDIPTGNWSETYITPEQGQYLWIKITYFFNDGTDITNYQVIYIAKDGAVYLPSIDENGIISWTNESGLPNPEPVSIKGPQGEQGIQGEIGPQGETGPQGEQGEKGEDGFSPILSSVKEDKNTIITIVDAEGTKTFEIADGEDGLPGSVKFYIVNELPPEEEAEDDAFYIVPLEEQYQSPLKYYDMYYIVIDKPASAGTHWEVVGNTTDSFISLVNELLAEYEPELIKIKYQTGAQDVCYNLVGIDAYDYSGDEAVSIYSTKLTSDENSGVYYQRNFNEEKGKCYIDEQEVVTNLFFTIS